MLAGKRLTFDSPIHTHVAEKINRPVGAAMLNKLSVENKRKQIRENRIYDSCPPVLRFAKARKITGKT